VVVVVGVLWIGTVDSEMWLLLAGSLGSVLVEE
jgi:hypothetical protein